jgi:hypothetical protein
MLRDHTVSVLLLACCVTLVTGASAQRDSSSSYEKISLGFHLGPGKGLALQLDGNVHFKQGYFFGLHLFSMDYNSENVPADYAPSCYFNCKPKDEMSVLSVLAGKTLIKNQSFQFAAQAGVSWVSVSNLRFVESTSTSIWSDGWNVVDEKKNVIGFAFLSGIDFQVSPATAISLTVYSNVNDMQSVLAPSIGVRFNSSGSNKKAKTHKHG